LFIYHQLKEKKMKQKGKIVLTTMIFLLGMAACLPLSALAAEEEKTPAPVYASDFLKGLEINGELRLRYEYAEKDVPDEDATDRLRTKFLMGMNWNNPDENWKIAAGLATGGLDGTSTNDTWSEEQIFETGDIRLDYAYAEHKMNNFKLLAGQHKNPYETTWALWDGDMRPAGFTALADFEPFFATAGWYQVRYADKDIAQMEAIQIGAKMEMATAALAFYNYHQVNEYIDFEELGLDSDYNYQIIDFYADGSIEADFAKFSPYAQVFYNVGACGEEGQSIQGGDLDPEEENLGWVLGLDTKVDKFKFGVAYAEIGADSVQQGMKDSDFGGGLNSTDVKGFKVGLSYALTKHCSVGTTAYLYEAMERDLDQDAKTYHVDMTYKF
jgi:hypothetical protein